MSYELVYFNIAGRALEIRLAFSIGKIEFKDTRVTGKEFGALKEQLPFGQLPVLKIDGKTYTQSIPIACYVAKKAGIFPESPEEGLECEAILHAVEDIWTPISVTFGPERFGLSKFKDEKEKLEVRKTIGEKIWPPKFQRLETLLKKNFDANGFAVGKKLSIADIRIYCQVKSLKAGFLDGIDKELTKKYPTLEAIYAKVGNVEQVKAWLEVEAKAQAKK
eukprot:CAMPEP_0114506966 /NCGR_PEP_ID=MMETSP0109-20121206/11739_1 /TAXON_ID=29199 /ORGANISM="Chlorarachnion reptans, Strain CCCM449" /LENGTH=219 /DNA_ID=CAMNT_0001685649 /DNA_START=42 /DNA_END=701 /DNA_ORIENTATION=-